MPVLFSFAQIIIVFRDVDVLVVNDIVLVNTSIAVIGVVFATVWASTSHWAQDRSRTALDPSKSTRLVFHHASAGDSAGNIEDVECGAVLAELSQTKEE